MIDKKRRMTASLPILMKWPAVTLPKRQVVVNGNTEIIITWEDSISINDGEIESYTVKKDDRRVEIFQFSRSFFRLICTIHIKIS